MRIPIIVAAAVVLSITAAHAQAPVGAQAKIDPARVDAVVRDGLKGFSSAPPEVWQPRLTPDDTDRLCSAANNAPAKGVADAIEKREKAAIQYPADGKFVGDWKKGEALAQSGYGLRFTDYPSNRPNGGNCYACHQLSAAEVSYGTIGPPLLHYGKLRDYKEADVKAAYEKIYNSQASFACSLMPRFGHNKVLDIEQIKDLVALLMSPDSPVNK